MVATASLPEPLYLLPHQGLVAPEIMEMDGELDAMDVEMQEPSRTPVANGRPPAPPLSFSGTPGETLTQRVAQSTEPKRGTYPHLLIPTLRVTQDAPYYEDPSTSVGAPPTVVDGLASGGSSGYGTNGFGVADGAKGQDGCGGQVQSGETVLGTFRPSIPPEVFEKIKEKITFSREREKQSLAKQILRKEEEKKKLARDRDADDLESKIRALRDNISAEKTKRQKLYNQVKQKMTTEESLKMQKEARDRGRESTNHVAQQHSYPNATMLISQTNPSMRPRLLNYPPLNVPLNSMLHQNNVHVESPRPSNTKRQRSVSPASDRNSQNSMSSSSRQGHDMSRGQPQPAGQSHNRISRPSNIPPDAHAPSPSLSSRTSGVKTPSKLQQNHGMPQSSNNPAQLQMPPQMGMTGPFTVNAPYSALGNQVLCIVPNMVGGQQGVSPQLINAAMLQKSDHFSALSPQQQQAIMAQQLHAMNPDYVRALQQAFEQQQQSARAAAAAGTDGGALYRQYANAGMPGAILQQPMLVRSAMQHQSIPQHGQNQPPHTSSAQVMTSSAQPSDGSQRVGSIITGIPVYGPAMGSPYGNINPPSGSNPANMYPRSGTT